MKLSERLAAGPQRGLGPTREIVAEVLSSPELLPQLIDALEDTRAVVTVRAANALQKIQREAPEAVAQHSRRILRVAVGASDLRTRWNLMEVVGNLPLKGRDHALAVDLLFEALASPSGFLRAFALTGLVHHAEGNADLKRRVEPFLQKACEDPSAAVRARARKLQRIR